MPYKSLALVGATGNLGAPILHSLLSSGAFLHILLLQRHDTSHPLTPDAASALSTATTTVRVSTLPEGYWDKSGEVAELLREGPGVQALVCMLRASADGEHLALATACCVAGVERMIPADFGSVDSSDPEIIKMMPSIYGKKKSTRDALQGLSLIYPSFSWTSLIVGHFLDFGLETPLFGFDLRPDPPTALIFDGGDIPWSATTRPRVGHAVAAILSAADTERTRNKVVYVHGISATQNQALAALEKAAGCKFDVKQVESKEYVAGLEEELRKRPEDMDVYEELVGVMGVIRADWREKETLMNEELGVGRDDLEEVAVEAWRKVRAEGK